MGNFEVVRHFDIIAPDYDEYKKKNSFYYRTLKHAIKEAVLGKRESVLDIGCGTGDILSFLNPARGLGIDVSSRMIQRARKKHARNKSLAFAIGDIEKRPVKGHFDVILFNDVIEHVVNKDRAIHHIASSMTSDTRLILTMANPFWESVLMLLEKLGLKMPEGPHFRISERDLFGLLGQNNLYVVKKKVYLLSLLFVYIVRKSS